MDRVDRPNINPDGEERSRTGLLQYKEKLPGRVDQFTVCIT